MGEMHIQIKIKLNKVNEMTKKHLTKDRGYVKIKTQRREASPMY